MANWRGCRDIIKQRAEANRPQRANSPKQPTLVNGHSTVSPSRHSCLIDAVKCEFNKLCVPLAAPKKGSLRLALPAQLPTPYFPTPIIPTLLLRTLSSNRRLVFRPLQSALDSCAYLQLIDGRPCVYIKIATCSLPRTSQCLGRRLSQTSYRDPLRSRAA